MKRIVCISLFAILGLLPFPAAFAQIGISVTFGPPALPVYEQPPCPQDGSIWVPGYWGWDADFGDYYWVPGTWVEAPEQGYLWTPPWWGWGDGGYRFHDGYWATEVGFYGGINYGYGYFGHGFEGGRWQNDHFYYNRAVMNVNTTVIHNVYEDKTVIVNNDGGRVSYNGGQGGIEARPTPREEQVAQMRHVPPPAQQEQRIQMARSNPEFRASANHGKPPVAATERPTDFKGSGVVPARAAGAPYHPPANREAGRGGTAQPGNENARPSNEPSRPTNENARPDTERPSENAPARPETHETPARPETHETPAPPETHETPARPTPEERPAPTERPQPTERPKPTPETEPRPEEKTEPQPERQHPEQETRPEPAPREERPEPKTEERHPQEQKPASKPKPPSKPKPEDKKKPE